MKYFYTTLFLLTYTFISAQIVTIPDTNFLNALIEEGVDTNNDGQIQVTEAESVINLNVFGKYISSLEGIQSFNNLEALNCAYNQLSSLNISQNLNLEILFCSSNQLSNLDISQNLNIETLDCSDNQLGSLDVSQNMDLLYLYCVNNQLTSLNINNGNNHNMQDMITYGNIDLTCIQVDDENATYPVCSEDLPHTGWCVDDWSFYNEDCSLGIGEVLETQISIYPNPVKGFLTIQTKNGITVNKITGYNILGKIILEEYNNVSRINISNLNSGLFFIQLETNKGIFTQKIIKE